ncbi:LysR family transcriptional regulator [Acetobacter indonesiensis]|uniref:LysR family transcriptional regulator n=1 Tax=Acetobacter indonesiensis TaxID=104101 RepID=UPI000A012A64|nr:LysR family transcriptional regulator [Acetobacter indonesiensis]
MAIKWLEDFITLSRVQSFSRVAEERHVTQSAFSRRIRKTAERPFVIFSKVVHR